MGEYVCVDCGYIFNKLAEWEELHGEILSGCPVCFGAAGEVKEVENEE
jgi:predicted  nucleic acid-binding Zn-ribbon protein